MEILSRQNAIVQGSYVYFTGLPCTRGHICKRYTKSSACYECLHPNVKAPIRKDREQRRAARARMLVRKFRIADNQLGTFMAQALGLALSYDGSLQIEDLETRGKVFRLSKRAGIYSIRIFPEMESYLRPFELQSWDEPPAGSPPIVVPGDYWPEHDPA